MTRIFCFNTCFLILIISLFAACNEHKNDKTETLFANTENFDSSIANGLFNQRSPSEQWEYVYEILQNHAIHNNDLEEWITGKLLHLFKNKHQIETSILRGINDELFHSDFYELQFAIASFTFQEFGSNKYIQTHATAAISLCEHYNFYKEKDSLAKYILILEKGIEHDTANWLKLGLYTNKANLAILNGQYFDAVVNYNKAIELTLPYDIKNQSTLLLNLADMYMQMDYIEKAYAYTKQALNMIGEERFSIENYISYGVLQFKMGALDSAEKTYQYVIQKAKESNMNGILAQIYSNYANLKNKQGLYEEAHQYLNLSDSICYEMNIEIGLLINMINRIEVWLTQKDFKSIQQNLAIAEKLAEKINYEHINVELYETMSKVYEETDNQVLADKYYSKYCKLKKQIKGDLPRSIIAEWELNKENEKQAYKNAAYELAIQYQIRKKYQLALGMSIVLLILSVFYFWNYKRNRKKQMHLLIEKNKIEYDLEIKSKELLSDSIKNISVQQTKDWLHDELNEIIHQLPRVHHHHFEKLSKKLKNFNKGSFLEEFDIRFTGVYDEFYAKLKEMAPDLTPNELRICAMMKLNISSKEIAMLSNRTIGTIENIRSNIRKKLHLPNEINLQEYLINL